jgi:hypothetical protein
MNETSRTKQKKRSYSVGDIGNIGMKSMFLQENAFGKNRLVRMA